MIFPFSKIGNYLKWQLVRWNLDRTVDAYIIGYPKVGNTWFQFMMARYVQLLNNSLDDSSFPQFDSINSWGIRKRWNPDFPRIVFTHNPLCWVGQTAEELTVERVVGPFRNRKVILLVRNPADILVSYYWHCREQAAETAEQKYARGIGDFIRDPIYGIEKLIRFYSIWDAQKSTVKAFTTLRYEDLKMAPAQECARILCFLNAPVDADKIMSAVKYSDFSNMRKIEIQNRESRRLCFASGNPIFATGDIKNTGEAFHVRRGKVGGFRDYLSDDDVEYLAERLRQGWPESYGYVGGFYQPDSQ